MRSELFEETIKQHKDSLTDELVQLGKHRQAQLAEWDIEQNETDYEFYFDSAWNYQQSKVDELQKRVEWLEDRLKATDTLSKMRAAVIGSFNSQEFNARTRRKMMILKRAEQALKGEGQ